ncbi:glycosyltransferase [Seonamhaeicola maritimus]|uniref:glycosyltransferase n=1 Tax=Seonamhaeicola maritimus TaxID=2591822 RepID=UPI00249545AB|nr:glycosyltransferase [Seonamhaeicola maritimus]
MRKKQIIVSLTSFPLALPFAIQAIQSILEGSVIPDKIVLYLTTMQFPNGKIPSELQDLATRNSIFEVRFYNEIIRSYTKLIPTIKDFPNDIIVTIDDDVRYHKNMLKRLLSRHEKYPNAIIGHRIRRIKLNTRYRKWKCHKRRSLLTRNFKPSFRNLQTGVGGVLYPPHSLSEEMLKPELFMQMAPTVDDIWFWAAAVANGTKIAPIPFGFWRQHNLEKPSKVCLRNTNIFSNIDVNRTVFESIIEKYPTIKRRFEGKN